MEDPKVRVRVGGKAGGGLVSTSEVSIALVGVTEEKYRCLPPFNETFVYLRLRQIDIATLLSPSFLEANTSPCPSNYADDFNGGTALVANDQADDGHAKKSLKRRLASNTFPSSSSSSSSRTGPNALVVVSENTPFSHCNAMTLAPKSTGARPAYFLRLAVDRETFHQLGLQASRVASFKGAAGRRMRYTERHSPVAIDVSVPATKREKWALSPERIASVDVVLSRGSIPPVPPKDCKHVAELHSVRGAEVLRQVPRSVCVQADIVSAVLSGSKNIANLASSGRNEEEDVEEAVNFLEALDSAQRILTGIGIQPDVTRDREMSDAEEGMVSVLIRRYDGFSNADLEQSLIEYCMNAVDQECAEYGIVGALGCCSAPHVWCTGGGRDRGAALTGFGGDAGVVTVIGPQKSSVSFELRAPCDL